VEITLFRIISCRISFAVRVKAKQLFMPIMLADARHCGRVVGQVLFAYPRYEAYTVFYFP
jgi:hypothetical protein